MSTVRLGDPNVAEVSSGQAAPQDEKYFSSSGYPFIRAGSLELLCAGGSGRDLEHIEPDIAKKFRLKLFPKGTVVFPKSGMSAKLGRVYCLDEPSYVVSHLAAVTPKEDLDARYLTHFLVKNPPSRLIPNDAYPSIRLSEIENITLKLPLIDKQRRIAAILDKADAIRRKRQEALKLVDDLVKSQFIEMFGDPVTNPMGWKRDTIRGVAKRISDGPFGSNLKSEHYAPDGVRVIRLQNIGARQFIDTDKAFVSLAHYEKLKKYTCRAGDVIIGTLGEPNLRACIIPGHIERAINKADCVHFVPDDNKVNGLFVCHYLNQPATLVLAEGSIHGQTRARISMSQVAALPIFLPPIEHQNQFSAFVEQADKSKFTMQRQLSEIETLSSALKQEFFA